MYRTESVFGNDKQARKKASLDKVKKEEAITGRVFILIAADMVMMSSFLLLQYAAIVLVHYFSTFNE